MLNFCGVVWTISSASTCILTVWGRNQFDDVKSIDVAGMNVGNKVGTVVGLGVRFVGLGVGTFVGEKVFKFGVGYGVGSGGF